MTHVIAQAYKTTHQYRETVFVFLVSAVLFTACAYVFLLQKAIVNVVQRDKISKEVKARAIEVGNLEETYFALKNNVTLDLAHAKGLKDAENVSYITKRPLTAMLSHNEL